MRREERDRRAYLDRVRGAASRSISYQVWPSPRDDGQGTFISKNQERERMTAAAIEVLDAQED